MQLLKLSTTRFLFVCFAPYLVSAIPVELSTNLGDISSIDLSQAQNLTTSREVGQQCNNPIWPWKKIWANTSIANNIMLLMAMHNDRWCYAPAGPAKCRQQKCNEGHAITLCNDNNYAIQVRCNVIGVAAHKLLKYCAGTDHSNVWFYGQSFDSQKWNIVLRMERCGEPEGVGR